MEVRVFISRSHTPELFNGVCLTVTVDYDDLAELVTRSRRGCARLRGKAEGFAGAADKGGPTGPTQTAALNGLRSWTPLRAS